MSSAGTEGLTIDLKAVLTKKMSEPSLGRERIKWQDIFVVGLNII